MAWQLNELACLHWRCWDDEWAVFDVGSGQTHQVDTLTAVTLMMIETATLDHSELVSCVAQELLIPGQTELSDALNGVLERLVTAGLIESVVP